ncbi:hypothetical protein DWF00_00510 [Bosea caraganae]|uniref:hypothetical protein n=1 Tax=Bosea caraganae TaxID=2763117 RepID=UPI000E0C0E5E|nr:hypothetical protein [Bosea caraganae]RDJ30583.1 hypothetical protein DWF00_00510 [Bosea caraganae]
MSGQELARLLLSIVLFPACVYVVAGTLATFPWWAYVVASFVLLVVATRSEWFGEAMLRCGTVAVLLLATASLFQVVPLANRACSVRSFWQR